MNDIQINKEEVKKIAANVEEELYKLYNKDTSGKYRNKYRSLIFNLKDSKNQGLFRKVLNGKISPERLVQMSAEELASSELAKWREREKHSMLEMIKRDAADKMNQVILKKTHKGEELIETPIVSDSPANEGNKTGMTHVDIPLRLDLMFFLRQFYSIIYMIIFIINYIFCYTFMSSLYFQLMSYYKIDKNYNTNFLVVHLLN